MGKAMDRCRSPAIIMGTHEFRESDVLVTFFTPEKGRLKGVAKGARRSRQRFVNCLDRFCLVEMEYGLKRERELCFIHSGRLVNAFAGLRSDFAVLCLASYMIELTEVLFPLEVAEPAMFELLTAAFGRLEKKEDSGRTVAVFEARAMSLGGYGVNLDRCCVCGRAYSGRGQAVFIRERGGVACLRCRRPSRDAPLVDPPAVSAMRAAQSHAFEEPGGPAWGAETAAQIRALLRLHRDWRIEKRLKTARYLE